ncbi:MAG: type II toxin-antitoxin system RelE/ParE family toxin [Magnetococcales bacterium]|nr:type II toxin-antitoxin system RelE/ParE family toxin [Magnetococcales bacterium]
MIGSFIHKGLEDFFYDGTKKGVPPQRTQKIADILDRLDAAKEIRDMDIPGYRLHPLKGDRKGIWAIDVDQNWRIIFRFDDGKASDINMIDYH